MMQAPKIRLQKSRALSTLARVLVVAALASVLGCGGGGPAIELPADPKAASQATLEALFSQITAQEANVKPGSSRASELASQHKIVGGELAERSAASVRTRVAGIPRVEGKIPLGLVQKEIEDARAIALREAKSKDVGRLRELLRSYAMQSPRY